MSRYAFPSQEPTNGQNTINTHYMTIPRRGSLEELRSNSASPLLSVRGVYVRSRPSSPSPPFNRWPRPLPESPQGPTWSTNATALHLQPHLGTSFAAFDVREKKGVPGTPYPRARVLSSASADNVHLGASRFAGPPPAYGDALQVGGAATQGASDEDDEVLYMDEARHEIEAEKTALLRDAAALLYYKVERDGGHAESRSLAGSEKSSAAKDSTRAKHSVKFSTMDDVTTFRRTSQDLPEGACGGARDSETRPDNRTVERHYSGSFFDHSDEETEPTKKRTSGWSKTLKMLKRRFSTSTSRKGAPPPVEADVSESLQPPSVIAHPEPGKVKASSASLFNVRMGPMRTQTPGSKSTRAPSVRSLSTGRNVLTKRPKASTVNTWETAALTSSARAVEGKMRPPSGSSSEYTDASRMSWEVPEDLQSQYDVLQEALEVVRRQKAENWVYTPAQEDEAGPSGGYVQVARRPYY